MLVPVNRSTIRKNPGYGPGKVHHYPLRSEVTEVRIKNDSPGHWVKETWLNDKVCIATAWFDGEECPKDWKAGISVQQHFQELHSFGDSRRYIYEHKDIEVTCNDCGEKFSVSELKNDCLSDDDGETYSDAVCPKCNAWGCVEGLDYEELNDAECEAFLAT